jgi:hypothetical protein
MSGTALDHPLIRDYLRELDAAFSASPAGQARELREQITAHLEDALPAGASDQEVAETLSRLGSPADLAAEAGVTAPFRSPAHKTRAAFARRSGRFWTILAVAVLVVGLVTTYVAAVRTAGVLQAGGGEGWWFQRDSNLRVDTSADEARQTMVPIRPGQRQGYYIHLALFPARYVLVGTLEGLRIRHPPGQALRPAERHSATPVPGAASAVDFRLHRERGVGRDNRADPEGTRRLDHPDGDGRP